MVAECYWLKGDQVVDVSGSSHLSALESNPRRFGLPLDLVSFAYGGDDFDEGEWYDYAVGVALINGWIRVRHNLGFGVDNWVFEFAEYEKSKKTIKDFVEALSSKGLLDGETDVLLDGRGDGFHRVCRSQAGRLPDGPF